MLGGLVTGEAVRLDIAFSYLAVFLARIFDVTLGTIRTILVVRGRRGWAAAAGFVEVLIYITALGWVMSSLDDPLKLVAYALGFASGTYVGMFVEEKLAIGTLSVQIIPGTLDQAVVLADAARESGFGVTTLTGEGREGPRQVLMVTLQRRAQRKLLRLVSELAPGAFTTALDMRSTRGGVFNHLRRKGK
jgi:uncharacterized protein YebE (UPF0316 family)